jgi:hypothetical protein
MRKLLIAATAVLMMATAALADHGGEHGGPGGEGFGGGHAIVGSDGTIYLTSSSTTNGTTTVTVKAIRSNGATAWTATLPAGARDVELSDGNLLTVVETRNSDGTHTSAVTAISTATGTTAWTKSVSGVITDLVPFSGGTYLFVTVPATTSGGTATRSIVALDNNGNTLWTVTL